MRLPRTVAEELAETANWEAQKAQVACLVAEAFGGTRTMAVEVASWPRDLSTWDEKQHPFYFELLGETSPQVDPRHTEIQGGAAGTPAIPIYEYAWTIGHGGRPDDPRGELGRLAGEKWAWADWLWDNLKDDPYAARVYVYFPVDCGWRVSELAATVKYMTPVDHQASFLDRAAKDWQLLQPLVDESAKLVGAVGPAGAAASASARMLGALAQLKINSVPQVEGFQWAAEKVTFGRQGGGVMQGVMWALPKSMFRELGGRLTGTLAVSFVPVRRQENEVGSDEVKLDPGVMQAHAVVHRENGSAVWAPASSEFVNLRVQPRLGTIDHAAASPAPSPVAPNHP